MGDLPILAFMIMLNLHEQAAPTSSIPTPVLKVRSAYARTHNKSGWDVREIDKSLVVAMALQRGDRS